LSPFLAFSRREKTFILALNESYVDLFLILTFSMIVNTDVMMYDTYIVCMGISLTRHGSKTCG